MSTNSIPTLVIPPIPRDTARLANAAFGSRNFYIQVGLNIEEILASIKLDHPSKKENVAIGRQAVIAMVTFFQFAEGLNDEQALDAVRTRVEWKYALHYPLHPLMFSQAALCNFRQQILRDSASQIEFQKLIHQLVLLGPPHDNDNDEFVSLQIVSTLCIVNRMEYARTALFQTTEILAIHFPNWLRQAALPNWYGRTNRPQSRFDPFASPQQQDQIWQEIRVDINHLLSQIRTNGSPEISELREVRILEQAWNEQYQHWKPSSSYEQSDIKQSLCYACISQR